jgi:hypothetical protein
VARRGLRAPAARLVAGWLVRFDRLFELNKVTGLFSGQHIFYHKLYSMPIIQKYSIRSLNLVFNLTISF